MSKYNYKYGRTPAKQIPSNPISICKGGSYMHQSGPTASYCQKYFTTPQGQQYYKDHSCRKHGILMGAPIDVTKIISPPMSDSNWNNAINCKKY